jgi:hypothetical protein
MKIQATVESKKGSFGPFRSVKFTNDLGQEIESLIGLEKKDKNKNKIKNPVYEIMDADGEYDVLIGEANGKIYINEAKKLNTPVDEKSKEKRVTSTNDSILMQVCIKSATEIYKSMVAKGIEGPNMDGAYMGSEIGKLAVSIYIGVSPTLSGEIFEEVEC